MEFYTIIFFFILFLFYILVFVKQVHVIDKKENITCNI
jgi:hypothetical protein